MGSNKDKKEYFSRHFPLLRALGKLFESFDDIRNRVKNIPDPKKAIEKRIFDEMAEKQRFHLFAR